MKPNYKLTRYSCYSSYIVQAITCNLAPLFFVVFQREFSISTLQLSNLILFTFSVQLAVDIISIKAVSFFGYKKSAIIANACAFIGLVCLAILPKILSPLTGIYISILIYSVGGGLIDVVINSIIEALPTDNSSGSLALLHSFYSWGQTGIILVSTLLILLFGDRRFDIISLIWSVIPFVNVFMFIKSDIIEVDSKSERLPIIKLLKSKFFLIFFVIMFCGGATELVISQWGSYFAEKSLGVSKVLGDLLGPCIFGLMMAVSRTLYGIFSNKINIFKAIAACGVIGIISYVGIALIPNPILVMVCFALSGVAASLLWPGTLTAASSVIKDGGAPLFALLALGGDLGCSLGPWLNGVISELVSTDEKLHFLAPLGFNLEQISLRTSILCCSLFPLILVLCLVFIMHKKNAASK